MTYDHMQAQADREIERRQREADFLAAHPEYAKPEPQPAPEPAHPAEKLMAVLAAFVLIASFTGALV